VRPLVHHLPIELSSYRDLVAMMAERGILIPRTISFSPAL
jgi:hypothetical protein